MSDIGAMGSAAKGLSRNPMGIIALFIVLIYGFAALTLGINHQLEQTERLLLVCFLIAFPVAVLAMFGWLKMTSHHEKLYAPADYRSDDAFLLRGSELRARRAAVASESRDQLKAYLREAILEITRSADKEHANLEDVVSQISTQVDRASSMTIGATDFLERPGPKWSYPIATFESIGDLTNEVYDKLLGAVSPFTYGYSWVMRAKDSGEVIKTKRMLQRAPAGKPLRDLRSLSEVGISPGVHLVVERPLSIL